MSTESVLRVKSAGAKTCIKLARAVRELLNELNDIQDLPPALFLDRNLIGPYGFLEGSRDRPGKSQVL